MKDLAQINKELMEVLTERAINLDEFKGSSHGDRFYRSITGYFEDSYFSVTLWDMRGLQCIEIAHTTDEPQVMIDILKEIEPDQPIQYTHVVITHQSKTA